MKSQFILTNPYIYNTVQEKHTNLFIKRNIIHTHLSDETFRLSSLHALYNRKVTTEIVLPETIKVAHIEEIILSNQKAKTSAKKSKQQSDLLKKDKKKRNEEKLTKETKKDKKLKKNKKKKKG